MQKTLILFLGLSLISGCASYEKNFKSQSVADIGFFADSTITMLGNLDLTLTREDTLLVRRFFHEHQPEEQVVIHMNKGLKKTLGNIVRYSIKIVSINESDISEAQKVQDYADYIVELRDDLQQVEKIDFQTFDDTIADIRQQEKLTEAIRRAQPLLNTAIMQAALQIEDFNDALEVLADKIDGRIDEEYADIIRYRAKLEREKFNIMTAFELIYDAYRQEEPNFEELRQSGVIWIPELIPEGRPTSEELRKLGSHLQDRMQALNGVQEAMQPNWEDYLATQNELEAIIDSKEQTALHARIIMLTWLQAHQKMASGVTSPAKWFDVGEVTKQLVTNASKSLL